MVTAATKSHFEIAYKNSYYTVTGCGGNLSDWRNGYKNLLKDSGMLENLDDEDLFFFTGDEFNSWLGLTGKNAYPEDLVFMTFSYKTVNNIGQLAMFKLRMQDRWFDDIVDNDLSREGKSFEDIK